MLDLYSEILWKSHITNFPEKPKPLVVKKKTNTLHTAAKTNDVFLQKNPYAKNKNFSNTSNFFLTHKIGCKWVLLRVCIFAPSAGVRERETFSSRRATLKSNKFPDIPMQMPYLRNVIRLTTVYLARNRQHCTAMRKDTPNHGGVTLHDSN